jgi:UDP-N-acetylmuramate-alanine ligase
MFVADLRAKDVRSVFVRDYEACVSYIRKQARAGDIILTMGARDPDLPLLARRIAAACTKDDAEE